MDKNARHSTEMVVYLYIKNFHTPKKPIKFRFDRCITQVCHINNIVAMIDNIFQQFFKKMLFCKKKICNHGILKQNRSQIH